MEVTVLYRLRSTWNDYFHVQPLKGCKQHVRHVETKRSASSKHLIIIQLKTKFPVKPNGSFRCTCEECFPIKVLCVVLGSLPYDEPGNDVSLLKILLRPSTIKWRDLSMRHKSTLGQNYTSRSWIETPCILLLLQSSLNKR